MSDSISRKLSTDSLINNLKNNITFLNSILLSILLALLLQGNRARAQLLILNKHKIELADIFRFSIELRMTQIISVNGTTADSMLIIELKKALLEAKVLHRKINYPQGIGELYIETSKDKY